MKKYKVEMILTENYVIDVLAGNEKQAIHKAKKLWIDYNEAGTYHYHQTGGEVEIGNTYDVTNTDDPFNP